MEPRRPYNKKYETKGGHDVQLSKQLSKLLRHAAVEQGLNISSDGYVLMDELLDYLANKKGYKNVTYEKIKAVVDDNDKKRFQIVERVHPDYEEKKLFIRATQGHSIKVVCTEDLLDKIEEPEKYPIVIHGTYEKFWPLIEQEGLKRMNRLHMHFAPGYPKEEGVISGMRSSCDVYIEIDMVTAMKDGINFYISSNNVILTEGIDGVLPTKYFKKVTKRNA